MANAYLKSKIKKYEFLKQFIIITLILVAVFVGRYFFFNNLLNLVVGLVLGAIGVVSLFLVEYFINKQIPYRKGNELETQIAEKLEKMQIKFEQHIETDYGDLDFFVEKNDLNYGVEAKNWAGKVTFESGLLKVAGWDNTDVLSKLLKHCLLVRNKKFGSDSQIFIHPVLVFGYKADVHVPQHKISFKGVEIIVATIKDFERFIK